MDGVWPKEQFGIGLDARGRLEWISATQTSMEHITPSSDHWQQKQRALGISVDPLTHQIRLIHPQFKLSALEGKAQQTSPGDSSPSNSFQNFIHDRLTILILILFIFVAELIFLGWLYGPSVLQYFQGKEKTKGSTFTRKPQRRRETGVPPFPDLEVETVVG